MFANDLLLFSEASTYQMQLITRCLNRFCGASYQKVNCQKTNILFLKNVKDEVTKSICRIGGFDHTHNLGKYLGIQLISLKNNCKHYSGLVDKLKQRLAS